MTKEKHRLIRDELIRIRDNTPITARDGFGNIPSLQAVIDYHERQMALS